MRQENEPAKRKARLKDVQINKIYEGKLLKALRASPVLVYFVELKSTLTLDK